MGKCLRPENVFQSCFGRRRNVGCMCCTLSLFRAASSSQGISVVQEWPHLPQCHTVGCKFLHKFNKLFLHANILAVIPQD